MVHLLQQQLKEKARELRQEASEQCAVKQAELDTAKEELQKHITQRQEVRRKWENFGVLTGIFKIVNIGW